MSARHGRNLAAGLILFLIGGLAAAQQPQKPQAPPPPPPKAGAAFTGGQLNAPTPNQNEVRQWSQMVLEINDIADRNSSNVQAARAAMMAAFNAVPAQVRENVLRWYIYRLTWEELHEGRVPSDQVQRGDRVAATIHEHMQELLGDRGASRNRRVLPPAPTPLPSPWVTQPPPASLTPALAMAQELHGQLLEEIRPICVKYLREVLTNQNIIARVNAVRVLDHFTTFGLDSIAPELLAVLDNPQELDAIKYWAVLGVGRLFETARDPARKTFKGDKGLETSRRCANAVVAWLDKQTKHDPVQLALMREEERQAISFMRRGAIQALAETQRPLVIDGAELGQAAGRAGPIAEVLLRIVANQEGVVQPPPTWTERVIAARAVCRLDPKLSPSYHPEHAVYVVAQFINEMANSSREADAATWSLYASELKGGLEALAAALPKQGPGVEYIQQTLLPVVHPVLAHINDRGQERTSPQQLLRTLEASKPPRQGVYKPEQR